VRLGSIRALGHAEGRAAANNALHQREFFLRAPALRSRIEENVRDARLHRVGSFLSTADVENTLRRGTSRLGSAQEEQRD
jgi:hypothetical protein